MNTTITITDIYLISAKAIFGMLETFELIASWYVGTSSVQINTVFVDMEKK